MNGEIDCSIMCRACMKVDGVLLPMYGDNTISKKNFPEKLADLASIQIDKYDGLPSVLCAKCAYRTDSFHEFKLQVQATEKTLRKMFQRPARRSVEIKSEFVRQNSDVDDYPEDKASATKNQKNFDIPIERKIEERNKDVKPILSNEQSDVTNVNGSMDLFNDENDIITTFPNIEQIFISQNCETSQATKNELPDEIKNILQSENMTYTLLYVSRDDEQIDLVDSPNNEHATIDRDIDTIITGETSVEINDVTSMFECNMEKSYSEEQRTSERMEISPDNGAKSSTSMIDDKILKKMIDVTVTKSRKKLRTKTKRTTSKDNDSETDYYDDTSENVLGSLNDTIMRIREIKIDNNRTNFQCTLCMENYDKLTSILQHTVETHVPKSGPFFCVVCEKDCESRRELRSHVKSHSGKYPYTCFVCNKAYSMKRYLKRHMSCHTDLPRHRCPKCGERFNLKAELVAHATIHDFTGPPFACNQCPRFFNHKGNYKRHLISHLDPKGIRLPKYPCDMCGKRFVNNRTLQTHVRVHTGEKPFECEICKRAFSQRGNLLNHQRIHNNPRSYTCDVCGKRFNQRATLRDHGLLHTGEKPYVCNVCGVAFTFSAALRRHMWSHATDKPFGCEICNARFVGKYDIKRHMKIHTDRPKLRRKRAERRNERRQNDSAKFEIDDNSCVIEDEEMIFFRQVLLEQNSGIIEQRVEAEKENVDDLLDLIEYE